MLKIKHMSKLLISSILLTNLASASIIFNYDLNDVAKFKQTNKCDKCDLSSVDLGNDAGQEHAQALLSNTNLSDARASYMNLTGGVFTNSNLTRVNFSNTNLSNADFTGAAVYQVNFASANLLKAKITNEQLAQAKSICKATLPDGSIGRCN